MRTISVSEAGSLFDCEAKWDYGYGGHLLGATLKKRNPAITLRRGRAWGRAVAAWHSTGDLAVAVEALRWALEVDAHEQHAAGVYVEDDHMDLLGRMLRILGHYIETTEPIVLESPELELRVALPSRTGLRASNRYVFQGFVDGLTRDDLGLWIVEYKNRDRLSSFEQVAWSRQVRWYAWAAERVLDETVQGVIVDERLNEIPKPARWVNAKRKGEGIDGKVPSHAVDQLCTPDAYRAACAEAGVEALQDTLDALTARRWHARHRVLLRRDEIERAGKELVSAGQLIAEMDRGERFPVANPSQFRCPGCAFKGPCQSAMDRELLDIDFESTVPKRHRPEQEHEVSAPTISLARRLAV